MRYLDADYAVSADADRALQNVAAAVAGARNLRVVHSAPTQITATETWRPLWTYLVAIVLFPIGLLALLVTREATLVISATTTSTGTTLRIHGRGHEKVCDQVLAAAGTRAAAADG